MSQLELAKARARAMEASQPSHSVPDGFYMGPEQGFITEEQARQPQMNTVESFASGMAQGYTAGAADEMALGNRGAVRTQNEAAQTQHPYAETAGRVVGAVSSPINKVLGPVRGVKDAAKVGAIWGGLEGFFSGEGGAAERLKSAGWSAGTGMLFGALSDTLARNTGKLVRATFKTADKRPNIETLRNAKNAAYAAVRKSGVQFDDNAMLALTNRLDRKAKTVRFELDPELPDDKAAISFMDSLKRRISTGKMSLNKLDQYRQKAWDRYSRTDNPFFLEIIGEIDNTIAQAAQGDDLIRAARDANSKYAKAQLLENAFRKARLQTSSTGSGGNILNKYRQAVTRIITTPREAKWFSPEEIALMERFVEGDDVENVLRRIGKLAPGGNGLMTALNVYAATVDPAMLTITAAASAAKSGADRSAMRGSEQILDAVSTGVIAPPRPQPDLKPFAVGGAAAGNDLAR